MEKFVLVCGLILLGLFGVYVINNNETPKPAELKDSALSLSSLSPTPSQTMNLNPSPTSSVSSKTNSNKAVIKTSEGNIELTLYPKEAPNTVNNFIANFGVVKSAIDVIEKTQIGDKILGINFP